MAVPARTVSSDTLATPWAGSRLQPPAPIPVSFSDLTAPVTTPRRPEPLTIRSAFVPRARAVSSQGVSGAA